MASASTKAASVEEEVEEVEEGVEEGVEETKVFIFVVRISVGYWWGGVRGEREKKSKGERNKIQNSTIIRTIRRTITRMRLRTVMIIRINEIKTFISSLKRVFLMLSCRDSAKFFICLHRSSTNYDWVVSKRKKGRKKERKKKTFDIKIPQNPIFCLLFPILLLFFLLPDPTPPPLRNCPSPCPH